MSGFSGKLGVLLIVLAGLLLICRFGFSAPELLSDTNPSLDGMQEARRLLQAESGIVADAAASSARLNQLATRFCRSAPSKKLDLQVLKVVETIAERADLPVQRKTTVIFSQNELGVSLGGVTAPQQVIRFLQQLSAAPIELKVKQFQLHALPEQRAVDFQITVSALVVD